MVEEYCRSLLKVAVAQLCQGLGWHAIHTTPCDLLTDVLQRYLEHLARHSHRYAEQYGRTDPNLDDVGLAFSHMHVRLNEFETYLKEVEPIPFAHPLPSFPVVKRSNLQIPQPGSRDCRERLEYIPEHMPPLVDIAGEFGEGLDAMDISHSSRMSFDADGYEPHTPLMSPTSPRGEKRELLSPTDYFAFKRLRMMDDGTPRELTAISMGVNGEITPKREGRLPVAVTPPQKPLVERRNVPAIPVSRLDSRVDGLLTKGPKSPRPGVVVDPKSSKGKGITPPKPKPKSPKHLFFSSGGTPSVFQVKPKSPAVVIIDKVKELMPSGSKNIKVMGPNIGTLLITTKKTADSPGLPSARHSDDDKSPSPKKPSALDVYDFEDEDTKPRPSKTFDPCGELPDPSKAVLPSATLIRDDEEEVVANAASIEDTIESVISKMSRSGDSAKTGKKNGKDSERERTKEKGKEKSKEKSKDRNFEKGKGGLLDMANKSNQDKSDSKGHSLPPKLLFKHAWRESEGAITSAIKMGTSPGLAPRLLIKTSDSKDKSKDKKDKPKKLVDEKSSGKESKKDRSKKKKEQLKKEKLKKKKMDKKKRLLEMAKKTTGSSGTETSQTDSQKMPLITKLNIITKNPKLMKVRVVSQSESPSSSPSQDKSNAKQPKEKVHLKKKRKEKERKAKVKAARDSLKKAKQKDGNGKAGEKKDGGEGQKPTEEPSKMAKLTVPKLMLKIGSASSSGEATKIFIKKPSENPKPPPVKPRPPSPSSSSSSSSSSSPPPSPPSSPPRHKSPSPSPSPSPRSPSPPLRSPSPPPKKTPALKKPPAGKKSTVPKKVPAAVLSPPSSPPAVPDSPPSPKSPPPPKVPVAVPPVRKAASKAFSAIAKPTKVAQPLSPGTSQPPAPLKGISVPTKASLKAPVEKPSTSKGGAKAATTQKAPGTPPPIGGVTVGGSAQRTVILETVGTVVSDTGERIWICPNCKLPDDGSPMVGCDTCDDWYHWPCVGIKEEPKEANWYCPRCRVPKKKKGKKKYK